MYLTQNSHCILQYAKVSLHCILIKLSIHIVPISYLQITVYYPYKLSVHSLPFSLMICSLTLAYGLQGEGAGYPYSYMVASAQ